MMDEGQDMNPTILDIFNNQDINKIIVGDPNQQIYAFRGAVNALGTIYVIRKHLNSTKLNLNYIICFVKTRLYFSTLYFDEIFMLQLEIFSAKKRVKFSKDS